MIYTSPPAHASGQYLIGGDLPVYRLGYGTMQLTGPGHWYHPADPDAAKRLLRRAVDLGINHLDTADAYGPETVEHYGHGLVIGTGGTPRAGIALTWKTDSYGWDSPAIFGDSGSPVRVTNLQAAGDLTHLVVDTHWLPSIIAGTRIGKMLQIAKGWALVNSPLCL